MKMRLLRSKVFGESSCKEELVKVGDPGFLLFRSGGCGDWSGEIGEM